jgi:hypothetical protein
MVAEVEAGAGRRLTAPRCEEMVPASFKRQVRGGTGDLYAREALQALQQPLVKVLDVRVLFVIRFTQAERCGENMLRTETRLSLEDALKAAQQQTSTAQAMELRTLRDAATAFFEGVDDVGS